MTTAPTSLAAMLLGAATLAFAVPTFAAEPSSEPAPAAETAPPATAEAPPASAKPRPKADAAGKSTDKRSGDIFQPSEEISEDFAVSFPVDI